MQQDLPVIPKINYDFDSEPNIFDNESDEFGEGTPRRHDEELQHVRDDGDVSDDQVVQQHAINDDEDGSQPYQEYAHTPTGYSKLATNSPHKQQIHDLESQNDKIRAVVSQMRNEMAYLQHSNILEASARSARENAAQHKGSKNISHQILESEGDVSSNNSKDINTHRSKARKLFSASDKYSKDIVKSATTTRIKELERLLTKSQDELLAAINEIQEYETQVSSNKAELTSCKFSVRQKHMHLQNAHRQIAMLQRQCDTYQDDLQVANSTNKLLERQLADIQLEHNLQKNALHHGMVQHSSDDFEKLVAENKFLRMKMEEATKDIKRLMHEKEKLIDISNMLRADIVQLTDAFETNRSKNQSESRSISPSVIDYYENKITELEMLVRKLDLHNKILKKDLADKQDEKIPQKSDDSIGVKGTKYDTQMQESMPPKGKTSSLKSQKQQDQKAKLLEQRSAISQTIQRKNNK